MRKDLKLVPTTGELSLFTRIIDEHLYGITGAYVGDKIWVGTVELEREIRLTGNKFESSARSFENVTFAGIKIRRTGGG